MKTKNIKLFFFVIIFICWSFTAWGKTPAQSLDFVLTPPRGSIISGSAALFTLYIHNQGDGEISMEVPQVLEFKMGEWPETISLQGRLDSPLPVSPVTIPAQGFKKFVYSVEMPLNFTGVTVLNVESINPPPVMLAVEKAVPDNVRLFTAKEPGVTIKNVDETGVEKSGETADEDITIESLFALYQPYLTNLAPYEPMYFLVGADPEDSKFQFSFRYRFFKPEDEFTQRHPWLAGLHFAYTQTSFWDLQSESAPFKDTSYKPEFFYASGNLQTRPSWMHGLFYQAGFQHESNGRDEEFSRSTNFLYVRPGFAAYHKRTKLGFSASSKIWTYINNEETTNPDLASYRGYFDLDVKVGKADSLVLGTNLRWAEEGGSVQADLTYPLHNLVWKHLNLCIQAQYVNSLAESLLHYKERTEALRIGFAMVR